MIIRDTKKGTDQAKVTFSIPAEGSAAKVSVVGEFNDWDQTATPLRTKGDVRCASLVLPAGSRYAFRYVTSDGQWFDDDAADAYETNEFGTTNSILDLTGASTGS